jgi:nucleoside-diphosphate-sugar epimerase
MKIAITGATGFIGRHVRNALAKTDHDIVLVVRRSEKAGEITVHETIVTADLHQERTDWFELFGKPDAVLHLAWGGLPNYMDEYHVEVELPMQSKFLSTLIDSGLKKLVVTGTCYEYGMSSGALSEDQETNPNTPYGIAKDCLRKDLFELRQRKYFDLTWARIFYPYGEGQSSQSLYSLIKDVANSSNPEIQLSNSDGVLDFISVIELSEILAILTLTIDNTGIVNLGSGHPKYVIDFARNIARVNNWTVTFISGAESSRHFESKCFWSDNSKLTRLLSKYNATKKASEQ